MHYVIGGEDRDLRWSGRLLNLAEPVIDRRKGILSFRFRENPAAASDHPGLVPCDELLVGIGDNNDLLRGREDQGSPGSELIEGMAVKDREELLGEVPPTEGKQACAASAGEDQGMYEVSSSMIEENMASPSLYRFFQPGGFQWNKPMGVVLFSTAAPPSMEPGRRVGTNKGLDGSGKPSDIPGHREDFL